MFNYQKKKINMKYFLLPLFLILSFTTSAQTTYTVEVGPGMTYTPDVLTIEEGDIVSWVSLGVMKMLVGLTLHAVIPSTKVVSLKHKTNML